MDSLKSWFSFRKSSQDQDQPAKAAIPHRPDSVVKEPPELIREWLKPIPQPVFIVSDDSSTPLRQARPCVPAKRCANFKEGDEEDRGGKRVRLEDELLCERIENRKSPVRDQPITNDLGALKRKREGDDERDDEANLTDVEILVPEESLEHPLVVEEDQEDWHEERDLKWLNSDVTLWDVSNEILYPFWKGSKTQDGIVLRQRAKKYLASKIQHKHAQLSGENGLSGIGLWHGSNVLPGASNGPVQSKGGSLTRLAGKLQEIERDNVVIAARSRHLAAPELALKLPVLFETRVEDTKRTGKGLMKLPQRPRPLVGLWRRSVGDPGCMGPIVWTN